MQNCTKLYETIVIPFDLIARADRINQLFFISIHFNKKIHVIAAAAADIRQ